MRLMLFAALAAALAVPALADTKAGVDAWERGDYKIAVDEWRKSAAKGDPDAMFNLGQAYKLGRGVPADTWKAQDFYRQAADKGHTQAADNYGLALFQNGRAREAIPYLEPAAERGDRRAQYILGTMLFNGVDAKKDWVRAYALLTRAARSGLPQATNTLSQMDQHIPADQRRKGVELANRMNAPPAPVAEVAGSGGEGMRGFDPPPSRVAERPVRSAPPPVAPPPARVARQAPPVVASGSWRLQLGAFGDAGNARRLGVQMAGRFPGRTIDYVPAGGLTRVLVGPFASRAAAQAACGSVKPCVPIGP